LGLPGLLDGDQMRALLRKRQSDQLAAPSPTPPPAPTPAAPAGAGRTGDAGKLADLRKELNSLVAMQHHRTGKAHGIIHGELRRTCGGPPTAIATAEQLAERIAALRSW
jgi:hypothetical protein